MSVERTLERRRREISQLAFDYAVQPKQHRDSCNLCGSSRLTTISQRDRYGYPASSALCERCGLVFLNPAMTPEAYSDFYKSIYRPLVSAYHGRHIAANTIQDEQRVYANEVAAFIEPLCRRRSVRRILDVGGSTGIVAHHLVEALDATAVVVDPAPLEIDEAKALGLETFSGFIEDFDAPTGSFDLATICQTIDHFLDVASALTTVRELLSNDGLLFVDIVDIRSTWLRSSSVIEALKIDHPFGFVEESAEYGLARFGFEVIAKEYAPDALHVRYLCVPVAPQPELEPDAEAIRDLIREIRRTLVLQQAN